MFCYNFTIITLIYCNSLTKNILLFTLFSLSQTSEHVGTRPSAVCRRGYAEIRGQIGHPTHPCLEKKHDGVDHDGCHPLHGAHQAIPRPWFESHQQRVDGEESANYQDETIDACHWIVGIVLKKNVRTFYVK